MGPALGSLALVQPLWEQTAATFHLPVTGRCSIASAPLLGALIMGQFAEMWFGTWQGLFPVFSQPLPGGHRVPREGAVRPGPVSPGRAAAGHSQGHSQRGYMCSSALGLARLPGHTGRFHMLCCAAVPNSHPGPGGTSRCQGKEMVFCSLARSCPVARHAHTGPFQHGERRVMASGNAGNKESH